jgi:transcriptional regulator GlxA family with amidase domain
VLEPFEVVFALYPRITQLDFTGPFEVFSRLPGARCTLASVSGGAVQAEGGLTFSNVMPLTDVRECTLLCVPGGFGSVEALGDASYLTQVRRLGTQARYVTSVCTGSLLLAAAGLLNGRKAACHWAWRYLLAEFGVQADPARIVRDGNIITGGGVTAGIDMALAVMADIAGPGYAQAVQLGMEYAPEPPFNCGRPEHASQDLVAAVRRRMETFGPERDAAVRRAAQRLVATAL